MTLIAQNDNGRMEMFATYSVGKDEAGRLCVIGLGGDGKGYMRRQRSPGSAWIRWRQLDADDQTLTGFRTLHGSGAGEPRMLESMERRDPPDSGFDWQGLREAYDAFQLAQEKCQYALAGCAEAISDGSPLGVISACGMAKIECREMDQLRDEFQRRNHDVPTLREPTPYFVPDGPWPGSFNMGNGEFAM